MILLAIVENLVQWFFSVLDPRVWVHILWARYLDSDSIFDIRAEARATFERVEYYSLLTINVFLLQISNRQHGPYNRREQEQRGVRVRSSEHNMSRVPAGNVWRGRGEVYYLQCKSHTLYCIVTRRISTLVKNDCHESERHIPGPP